MNKYFYLYFRFYLFDLYLILYVNYNILNRKGNSFELYIK